MIFFNETFFFQPKVRSQASLQTPHVLGVTCKKIYTAYKIAHISYPLKSRVKNSSSTTLHRTPSSSLFFLEGCVPDGNIGMFFHLTSWKENTKIQFVHHLPSDDLVLPKFSSLATSFHSHPFKLQPFFFPTNSS